MRDDTPLDPFAGDPLDPASALDDEETPSPPLSVEEREDILAELEELEVFQALLEPRGVRGLVTECPDCDEPHYYGWDLLRGSLRSLLDHGQPHVHEPAFGPDPADYVSWDYARGFADGVLTADEE